MDTLETLEAAWNKQIDIMRNVPHIREWYRDFGTHNSWATDKTPDGRTVICEVLLGKQLQVSIPATERLDPEYNRKYSSSLTRNIPHDLQRLFKGKE